MDQQLPPPMFLADAPGLDFLNSVATPVDTPVEWLGSGKDFLAWLSAAKLAPASVLEEFARSAGPGELDAIAAQARGLREWFRGFVVRHKGRPLPDSVVSELEPLNRLLARDEAFVQIVASEANGVARKKERRWRTPESLLLPLAEAMANVVCDDNFTYVKACEGPACTMLFLDRTKGHARRWCSMAVCGNRAKQAAHRSRKNEGNE
jgi:predicted RNA-binding Zn ribbon-like protein